MKEFTADVARVIAVYLLTTYKIALFPTESIVMKEDNWPSPGSREVGYHADNNCSHKEIPIIRPNSSNKFYPDVRAIQIFSY